MHIPILLLFILCTTFTYGSTFCATTAKYPPFFGPLNATGDIQPLVTFEDGLFDAIWYQTAFSIDLGVYSWFVYKDGLRLCHILTEDQTYKLAPLSFCIY